MLCPMVFLLIALAQFCVNFKKQKVSIKEETIYKCLQKPFTFSPL